VEVPPRECLSSQQRRTLLLNAAGLVQGLVDRKITQIASGNQHSLAMDNEGYVYAWGFAGYSRLGLQDQKDR
jgi:alpha-tubulin suppressor-like RCC1 family protein